MSQHRRFQFLEVMALWEGRITATRIVEYFDVSRQTAQKVISDYQEIYPFNFAPYDNKQKAHIPAPSFQPQYTAGAFEEYLHFMGPEDTVPVSHLSNKLTHLELLPAVERNMNPAFIRDILKACKQKLRLDIGYYSVSSGINESRIISPHTLVFDGIRWHARAYCERSGDYRDFVLSRFHEMPVFEGEAVNTIEHDTDWNKIVTMVIQPDPRLSPNQKKAIELDYRMTAGELRIYCRAALIKYLMQRLRLDSYSQNPKGQQIIVETTCWEDIAPYRF